MFSSTTTGFVQTSIGPAVPVSATFFVDKVLPPLPPGIQLDELITNKLKIGGSCSPLTGQGKLRGYNSRLPSAVSSSECVAYRNLQKGAEAFARAVEDVPQVTTFHNNLHPKPALAKRPGNCLPDVYLALRRRESTRGVDWMDIVVPGEYKTKSTEENHIEVRLSYFRLSALI